MSHLHPKPCPTQPTFWEGRELEIEASYQWPVINQVCLYNEASIKPQRDRGQRASRLVNTQRCWREVH